MKLSGHVTIEVVNELTGEIVNTIEQDNIITDIGYNNDPLLSIGYWNAEFIFISTETGIPTRSKTSIQCSGTATRGVGQPQMQVFSNANPPYFVITQRFESVGTARTFSTVGLTPNNPGQVVNTTVTPHAYLLLSTPCTQEVNQILNVVYRITVDNVTPLPNQLTPFFFNFKKLVTRELLRASGFPQIDKVFNTVSNYPLKEYGWISLLIDNLNTQSATIGDVFGRVFGCNRINDINQRQLFFRSKQNLFIPRDNIQSLLSNGRVYNTLLFGRDDSIFPIGTNYNNGRAVQADQESPLTFSALGGYSALGPATQTINLQSAFSYSANPRIDIGPMFLPDNNPSGTGVISFSEDPWTGTWPTIYRIRITESGQVGTAKFVLGVKNFTSFRANENFTLTSSTAAFHPFVTTTLQPYPKCHGWQLTMPILAWNDVLTVQADNTGVSIINQFTGQHWDFDATTSPALPITSFRQMAFDQANNFIYIACAATGLYRINVANFNSITITRVSTTPCYAVDVDAAGNVYVFMNISANTLTLTSSVSNYVTALNFSTVALTTANRVNIYVNKLHPSTRLAIAVRNANFSNSQDSNNSSLSGANLYWWSLAVGNEGAFGGASPINVQLCGESQCSFAWVTKSDSRMWTGSGLLLIYGTTNALINNNTKVFAFRLASETIFSNADRVYDPEALRLLSGALLADFAKSPNVNIAQDQWGYMIPGCSRDPSVGGLPGNGRIISPSTGAFIPTFNSSNVRVKQVGMPNGIVLSANAEHFIFDCGMDSFDARWIWYKWNGTNWIPAVDYDISTNTFTNTTGTNTRTTSNTPIPLLDGINISFTNGATGTSFVQNEVYDQYVCKGFLKTNDTSLYIENSYFYTQPVFERVTLTPRTITNNGIVVDGAPGNTALSSAVSAITVNPLWFSLLPEYIPNQMVFNINGVPITRCFSETIDTLPAQSSLLTRQVIAYRNGLILCSTADAGKIVTGYFSYVARSN